MSLTVETIFTELQKALAADPSLASKVNGTFLFKLGDKQWSLDTKSNPAKVAQGAQGTPEVTITISDADFINLMTGKATGQNLFMQGKLKVIFFFV